MLPKGLRTVHLFAGAGGGILADIILGHRPVCAVEIDKYCRAVLKRRMLDKALPWFPLFGDVKEFDGRPWRGVADVVSGGFPCQDISIAGKRRGIKPGTRSGLWHEFARVIGEARPPLVFVENSPLLVLRGLDVVLRSLASMGYDARWGVLGAWHLGGVHQRERIWLLAYDRDAVGPSADAGGEGLHDDVGVRGVDERQGFEKAAAEVRGKSGCPIELVFGPVAPEKWRRQGQSARCQSLLEGVDDGLARRLERQGHAIGNGQVPQVAAAAFLVLSRGLELKKWTR